MICAACKGHGLIVRGRLDWEPCQTCGGSGVSPEPDPEERAKAIRHSWSQAIAEQRAAMRAVNEGEA